MAADCLCVKSRNKRLCVRLHVYSYSVAMAAAYWLPCCWLEGGVEPAVAMVAEDQKGEVAAGCWEEGVEVASYSLEEATDLQGNKKLSVISSSHLKKIIFVCSHQSYKHQLLPMGCP